MHNIKDVVLTTTGVAGASISWLATLGTIVQIAAGTAAVISVSIMVYDRIKGRKK